MRVRLDSLHMDPVPEILFEDARLLIANKPPFVVTNGPGSFENRLRRLRKEPSLRAVHRLDRDTSGCLIIAREPSCFDAMVERFRAKEVEKVYEVIVHGSVPWSEQSITEPVDCQSAISHVIRLAKSGKNSLLEVKIETGRKHQIRKHLAGAGFPVVGDAQYGPGKTAGESRQMLHAIEVAFPNPFSSENVRVKAPHFEDFSESKKQFAG